MSKHKNRQLADRFGEYAKPIPKGLVPIVVRALVSPEDAEVIKKLSALERGERLAKNV